MSILFSVVCPAYNAGNYIEEAINSVLHQSYKNWELIIVDDGSTDNTAEVAKRFTNLPNISYHWQPNGKQGKARNLGISKAKGDWIAFLDADDVWLENKLERQVEQIKLFDAELFCSGAYLCDAELRIIDSKVPWNGLINGKKDLLPSLLQGINPIIFNSVVIKKSTLNDLRSFNEVDNIAEDYELFLRMCDTENLLYCTDEKLVKYRFHYGQTSHSPVRAFELCINAFKAAKMKSISLIEKNVLIRKRLIRFLVHNIDILKRKEINRIVRLFPSGLSSSMIKYSIYILSFNKKNFKRLAYRYNFVSV
jgi:glycosyltransferase involved in cell wall biosynthesis